MYFKCLDFVGEQEGDCDSLLLLLDVSMRRALDLV